MCSLRTVREEKGTFSALNVYGKTYLLITLNQINLPVSYLRARLKRIVVKIVRALFSTREDDVKTHIIRTL